MDQILTQSFVYCRFCKINGLKTSLPVQTSLTDLAKQFFQSTSQKYSQQSTACLSWENKATISCKLLFTFTVNSSLSKLIKSSLVSQTSIISSQNQEIILINKFYHKESSKSRIRYQGKKNRSKNEQPSLTGAEVSDIMYKHKIQQIELRKRRKRKLKEVLKQSSISSYRINKTKKKEVIIDNGQEYSFLIQLKKYLPKPVTGNVNLVKSVFNFEGKVIKKHNFDDSNEDLSEALQLLGLNTSVRSKSKIFFNMLYKNNFTNPDKEQFKLSKSQHNHVGYTQKSIQISQRNLNNKISNVSRIARRVGLLNNSSLLQINSFQNTNKVRFFQQDSLILPQKNLSKTSKRSVGLKKKKKVKGKENARKIIKDISSQRKFVELKNSIRSLKTNDKFKSYRNFLNSKSGKSCFNKEKSNKKNKSLFRYKKKIYVKLRRFVI